jgi:hypothetical protein
MKKILVSILMIGTIAIPATAKIKAKAKNSGHIPYALNPVIDHSKDVAYSAQWADQAQSPAPDADFSANGNTAPAYTSPGVYGGTQYYTLKNFTLYAAHPVSMNAPYLGGDAPSYDGAAKNAYRNMRANNESEPLPANDGK